MGITVLIFCCMRQVDHRSHSQLSGWLRCGKQYELERIAGVQPRPAWWLLGGSAVHRVIERWLRQQVQREASK